MKKLKFHYNPDTTAESCPNCGREFTAKLMDSVCDKCGFISFGCSICPYPCPEPCGTKKCPISGNTLPGDMYAVFTKKAYDALPEGYKALIEANANSTFTVLADGRLVPVYTSRRVYGLTTIDPDGYRPGNDLGKYRKFEALMDDED